MAESLGGLYIRLGLSLSELQSDFIAAERTITQNMARLSREQQIIKLRAQVDIAGLDPDKDAAKILEVQMKALNQQIASQKDRLKLAEVGLQDTAQKTGELSAQTQKATISVEREKLALQNLENELKNLSNQKIQINADSLRAQFSDAQRIIEAQISSLNQKNSIIKMRAEFDMTGLDKSKNASKILEVQTKSLNQQIKNQQAILKMTEAVMRETASRTGQFSAETLKATANVEREKLALKHLEEELKNVTNEQKQLTDQQAAANKNPLLNGYKSIKSDVSSHINNITTSFNGIKEASKSADGAITKSLEIIGNIPHPVGKAAAALVSIPLIIKGIESSLINMAKPAIAAGDSVYVMSRGMQLSVAEMGKLSTVAKVTGIDVNEVNSNLRRLGTQFVKSGNGSLMTKMLDKYDVKLTDVNGNLKKGVELSLALADGLKKAQAEGKGAEFIAAVGGKFWSGDFVTYLEDLRDNIDAAGKIVKNKLANPAFEHQVQGELNAMDTQAAQLGASFSSALVPVVHEIVPRLTERMGELTKVIAANKENIKFMGDAIALPIRAINDLTGEFVKLSNVIDEAKDKGTAFGKVFEYLGTKRDDFAALMNVSPMAAIQAIINPSQFTLIKKFYSEEIQEYKKSEQAAEEAEKAKVKAAEEKNKSLLSAQQSYSASAANIERAMEEEELDAKREAAKEAIKIQQEASDIIYKISHNEYENKKLDLLNWRQELLNNENTTAEQRLAIEKLYLARLAQLEKERADKINEIREEIASKNRTDLENEIAQIESTMQKRINAGLPAIEAEKAAEQEKKHALQQLEESFAEARGAVHQTELEKRLAQIDKEKEAWIKKGIDEVDATKLAEQQKAEIIKNHKEEIQKTYENFYDQWDSLYQTDLEKELSRIDKARDAWIQKGIDEVKATQWAGEAKAQAMIKTAQKEEQEARQREQQRKHEIEAEKRAAIEKANAQRNAALQVLKSELEDYRLYQEKGIEGLIEKQKQELYKIGVTDKDLQMTPQMLNEFKEAQHKAMQNLLPNFKQTPYQAPWDNYNPPKREKPYNPPKPQRPQNSKNPDENQTPEIKDPAQAASDGLSDVADAGTKAAEALKQIGNISPNPQNEQPTPIRNTTAPLPIDQPYTIDGYVASDDKKLYLSKIPGDDKGRAYTFTPETIQNEMENGRQFDFDPSITADWSMKGKLDEFLEPFQNLGNKAKDAADNLSDLSPKLSDFKNDLPEMITPNIPDRNLSENLPDISGIDQSISNVSAEIQNAQNTISEITSEMTQKLSDETAQMAELVNKNAELGSYIDKIGTAIENQQPSINATNNITIGEAHAWDSNHIQELADKVAAVILPTILRALGGGRNSY